MAAKFENFLILPDFLINFRKSHQVSKNYLKRSKRYGQKPLGGSLKTPGLNKVNDLRKPLANKKSVGCCI